MAEKRGTLFVVSGPSGSGKGTVLGEVLKKPGYFYSVSDTTRAPRDIDIEGVTYNFLSKEAFLAKIECGGYFEYNNYVGNYYGTPKAPVEEALSAGIDVLLEIDVNGAMAVKRGMPEAVLVFILPPSLAVVRQRLEKRGTETEEKITKRMSEAAGEVRLAVAYDYVVVNDKLEDAVLDFESVVRAHKLKTAHMCGKIDEVLDNA